jgi:hypothetical protein
LAYSTERVCKGQLFFDLDKYSIEGNFQGTEREGGSIFNFPLGCFLLALISLFSLFSSWLRVQGQSPLDSPDG